MSTVTIYANSQGTCQFTPVGHATNLENINSMYSDYPNSYNRIGVTTGAYDRFSFPSTGVSSGTINKVTFKILTNAEYEYSTLPTFCFDVYTNSNWYQLGSFSAWQIAYSTYDSTTNPNTGSAWTWTEVNSLSVGYNFVVPSIAQGARVYLLEITVTYDVTTPAAPTNVTASTNSSTEVLISWTKSAGATGYRVYTSNNYDLSGLLGDVDHFHFTDDSYRPIITPGTASASDGISATYVSLSLSGQSIANGSSITCYVKAETSGVQSTASSNVTGYRIASSITYQWQVSAADSNTNYSNINGATTASYNYSMAANTGRYFKCLLNATGSYQETSTSNRGYTLDGICVLSLPTISSISNVGATCSSSITSDGGDAITARGVCWNTTGTPTTSDSKTTDGTGTGTFTSTLSSLGYPADYYVRSYATNSIGTYYSSEVRFRTDRSLRRTFAAIY